MEKTYLDNIDKISGAFVYRNGAQWTELPELTTGMDFYIQYTIYTTHNLISIIALISTGLTAMSLSLRYSITSSVCLRFHRNLQW